MKVLFVTNDFPPMAGGEATCYARICATVPADQVLVLAPRIPGHRAFDTHQPYRIIRRWAPTSHNPLARLVQLAVLLVAAGRLARRKRADAIHIGHLYLGLIGWTIRRVLGVPYVLYLHGGEMAAYLHLRPIRAIARVVVRGADRIVANSRYTVQRYEAMGMHNSRVEILTRGADLARFHGHHNPARARARYGLDGARVLLTVGRLIERKGHDMVIRVLSRVQETAGPVLYAIAGSGPEESRLRALASEVGCHDSVRFLGYVSDADLPDLFSACDVFVMPSRALASRDGVEGYGAVFLEAGACAKPVVGGRSGGIPDAVIDGVTGILVDPTNADELAEALSRLLLHAAEATRMGRQGRQRVEAIEADWAATLARLWGGTPSGGERG